MRLDMARALALAPADLSWREYGEGTVETRVQADPSLWGDFVLKRKEMAASYHLAVVIDDAAQGVSDVMRGNDLFRRHRPTAFCRACSESPPRAIAIIGSCVIPEAKKCRRARLRRRWRNAPKGRRRRRGSRGAGLWRGARGRPEGDY